MSQELKQELYAFCLSFAEGRIARIQSAIVDLKESLDAETKSSSGDKHETGRAMLQLEMERAGSQLAEAETMGKLLDRVDIKRHAGDIGVGNLVFTSKTNYFISIAAGEFECEGINVFCISPNTPMGKLLLGKTLLTVVYYNGEKITVLDIA